MYHRGKSYLCQAILFLVFNNGTFFNAKSFFLSAFQGGIVTGLWAISGEIGCALQRLSKTDMVIDLLISMSNKDDDDDNNDEVNYALRRP